MLIVVLVALTFIWSLAFALLWKIPYPRRGGFRETPTVSIIIPARNEEKTLPALLESLNHQDFASAEVIVVDDHSEDGTPQIAATYGAQVIQAEELPKGWLGKPWACWQGACRARGELFLFLDADTAVEPGGLERIVSSYLRVGGLLSVWPYHRMKLLYERLSAVFNIIIMASMGSFTLRGAKADSLGAFGPCVVCSKTDYFASGGHEKVRGAILEDVALGQSFLRAGFAIHNFGGKGSISFRMYPAGIHSLITGFSKGLASGAREASRKILAPMICWIAGGFIVSFWLLFLLLSSNLQGLAPWLILNLLYILQIHWILSRMGNYGVYTALLYPIPLVFFAGIFMISLMRTFLWHQVSWKGRKIDIER